MAISEKSRKFLEDTGETAIRSYLERGTIYPYATEAEANEWLEEVYLRRLSRSNSEQIRLTREANDIARQARNAARAAAAVASIGIVIAVLAWFFPHH